MKKSSDAPGARRRFLQGAVLTGSAVVFTAATRGAAGHDVRPGTPGGGDTGDAGSKGYHPTPHIEAYYRSARD